MMTQTMDLAKGAMNCSRGAKITEGVSIRDPHSFPGNLWEAHPLQEERVWKDRVNTIQGIQSR